MEEKNNKKSVVIIGIVLLILVIGATYAYFVLSNGDDAQGGVHVTSNTTDSLVFEIEHDIELKLDTETFLKDMGNIVESTKATAELVPNNKNNHAEDSYNMYFIITDNKFNYVTDEKKAEILLSIVDTKGTEATTDDEEITYDIDGLQYVTVDDGKGISQSGYDITKGYGTYKLISDKEIVADIDSETHSYKIEVKFINYDENQSENAGKNLDAIILLSREDYEEYKPRYVNKVDITKGSNITVETKVSNGSSDIDKYYYKIEEVEESPTAYIEKKNQITRLTNEESEVGKLISSDNNSYTFTRGIEANKEYNIYAYTVDNLGIKSNIYKETIINDDKELPNVNEVESEVKANSITLTVTASENTEEYCYSINNERYECTNSNTHVFNNIDSKHGNNISVYVKESNGNESLEYNMITEKLITLSNHIKKLYTKQSSEGEKGIYLHDGQGDYSDSEACWVESGVTKCENSYRYTGSNSIVKNYVCFGGECDTSGTSPNLYRIIGVFNNKVKLIKATEATSSLLGGCVNNNQNSCYGSIGSEMYYWYLNDVSPNIWSESKLNLKNLNSGYTPENEEVEDDGFLAHISEYWRNMIENHDWIVGGNTYASISKTTAKNVYNNEIIQPSSTKYTNKIGLMYVSDYMYAVDPKMEWTNRSVQYSDPWANLPGYDPENGADYRIAATNNKNWLYLGKKEWTITRRTDMYYGRYEAFCIYDGGIVHSVYSNTYVRPTFYLNSNVSFISGSGEATNPFIISF